MMGRRGGDGPEQRHLGLAWPKQSAGSLAEGLTLVTILRHLLSRIIRFCAPRTNLQQPAKRRLFPRFDAALAGHASMAFVR